ncbi:aminotransferase class I/II-fold pyridoxal phosphate-dependent enzyme [Caballeronia mineralivorans]|jgi:histidinol-phosphate aminotransferase|uniref:aminotransferase class I/II-fold pyridoxal phosphate-dependent enzyme n=1 Tax=Caballeronia mineralivorans TaxID=2010198 RepID=UPI0023F0DD98|nr:aminotransferase class I/II-fold pyridoxal phosphate-dependent enzyme [Caballeronia mineralivorans]MDB5783141.1 histidinol-phosphate aminotransferase [Caballeronia mineralivorans]MEA3096569.1 histidinol-phosphate aminotransferase [Caballeronia mineralivorans]
MSVTAFIESLRAEVRGLPAYNAGLSGEFVRARYGVSHVAKLGSNENPRGASAAVLAHLAEFTTAGTLALYPDPSCSALRSLIAERLAVDPEQLLFGNGSEDLLAIAAHTFLAPGDEVITVIPSFGLHIIYPQSVGAKVVTVPMRADFEFDVDALIAAVSPRTRMLIVSNPSNPVGCAMDAAEMRRLLNAVSPGTLVLWDEAYFEYAADEGGYPDSLAILRESGLPWLLLRTFSKAYGLAALRVGYGVASAPELAGLMNRVRTPFNINQIAQQAAAVAFSDQAHVVASVEAARAGREWMRAALVRLGINPARSCANFLFFDCGEDATKLAGRMLEDGVIVKPWREAGYETCMRVSVGSTADNALFMESFERRRGR